MRIGKMLGTATRLVNLPFEVIDAIVEVVDPYHDGVPRLATPGRAAVRACEALDRE